MEESLAKKRQRLNEACNAIRKDSKSTDNRSYPIRSDYPEMDIPDDFKNIGRG